MGRKTNITALAFATALGAVAGSGVTYFKVKPRRLTRNSPAPTAGLENKLGANGHSTELTPEAPNDEGLVALAAFINAQYERRGERDADIEAAFARRDQSGQHPAILRVGCSDSYLPDFFNSSGLQFTPGIVFSDANPGNSFFLRVYDSHSQQPLRAPDSAVAYFMAHFAGEGGHDGHHAYPSKYHEAINLGHTNCGAMAAIWRDATGRARIADEAVGLREHLNLLRSQPNIRATLDELRGRTGVEDRYATARLAEANVDDQIAQLLADYPAFVGHGGMAVGIMFDMDHSYRRPEQSPRGSHVIVNINGATNVDDMKRRLAARLSGVTPEAIDYAVGRMQR